MQQTKNKSIGRKLVIAGALLILAFCIAQIVILNLEFSSILNSILGYSRQAPLFPAGPYFIGPNIFDFNLDIIIFGVSLLLLSSALILSAYKAKQENPPSAAKWARLLLPLSILLIIVSVAEPHILLDNDAFLNSLLPSAISLFGITPALIGTAETQAPVFSLFTLLILPIILLAGALLAICGSLLSIWGESRKYAISVVAVSLIAIVMLSAASYIAVMGDNAAAIAHLNREIATYNTGYSYLLSNSGLYTSTIGRAALPGINGSSFYDTLISAERPHTNLSSFFTAYNGTTTPRNPGYTDFGTYNPVVRAVTIASLGFSGLPVDAYTLFPNGAPSNWLNNMTISKGQLSLGPTGSIYLMPPFASSLKSIYELNSVGNVELLTSAALSNMFSCDVFDDNSYPAPAYYGISIPVENPQFLGNSALTGESAITKASAFGLPGQLPLNWLALSMDINGLQKGIANGYFQCSPANSPTNSTSNTTELSLMQLFYMLSLVQYSGYGTSQMLYNQSFGPGIEFLGYQGNYLIVNLGNLNLTSNAPIKAYIDNRSIKDSRYFNYLLAQNLTLSPGFHNLEVTIGSNSTSETRLNTQFFVSPFLMLSSIMNESGMQISITNPSGKNILIHNPELFANTTNQVLNASFQNIGYTYAGIGNFSLTAYNVTSITNSTGYKITINGNQIPASSLANFTLGANKTIKLIYATGQYCTIGQEYTHYLYINTSAGRYFQVVIDSCT